MNISTYILCISSFVKKRCLKIKTIYRLKTGNKPKLLYYYLCHGIIRTPFILFHFHVNWNLPTLLFGVTMPLKSN